MDTKIENSFDRFDTSSSFFKFLSVAVSLGLLLYLITRKRKKASSSMRKIDQFPWSKYLFCALKHVLGKSKVPLTEIFMKFGDLFYLCSYTRSPMIVVSNDYELIKHILNSPDWTGRPEFSLGGVVRNGGCQDRGILLASGDVWKDTRRHTVKTMSQLGLGKKNNLENTTIEQMKNLLKNLEKTIETTDNKVPVRNLFSVETINVIWRIIEGTEFSKEDPKVHGIIKAADIVVETNYYQLVLGEWMEYFILRTRFIFDRFQFFKAQAVMKKYFADVINRSLLTIQENDLNAKDSDDKENFTDSFVRQIILKNKENNKMEHIFNVENLMVTLFDIFEAGVETTSSTLEFAIMFLAMHPDVQQKMQKEIKTVKGDDDPSYCSDRTKLPYTQAVIQEVHRMSSIVPMNFRRAVSDCYINDIFIKKDTAATINVYSVHYDNKFWKDPYNFRPERFLGSDGGLDPSKFSRILSFGGGKRLCVGERVANTTVFTFLVGMLQKYKVHLADPDEDLGLETNSTFTSRAKPFHMKFVPV